MTAVRPAALVDAPLLEGLIERSVRRLQASDYTPEQIDRALGTALGLDLQLVTDGTYFIADVDGGMVGCGGWSRRKTLFGSHHLGGRNEGLLDPQRDAAKIRAFFIEPEWARQGIATLLLARCEAEAMGEGFFRFELGATLTGVAFYLARGYRTLERIEVPLSGGITLPVIRMAKEAKNPVS